MRLCSFPDCGRRHHARGWCSTHYLQWQRRADVSRMTPIGTSLPRLSSEDIELDIADFEHLLSAGCSLEEAVRRMGMHPRSMIRRYRVAGRQLPAGMWGLELAYRTRVRNGELATAKPASASRIRTTTGDQLDTAAADEAPF